jgi:hypothetical protein
MVRAMQVATTEQERGICNMKMVYYFDARRGLECADRHGRRALVSNRALLWLLEEVRHSHHHRLQSKYWRLSTMLEVSDLTTTNLARALGQGPERYI